MKNEHEKHRGREDENTEGLSEHERKDLVAIQQGIDDMEAGHGMTIQESQARTMAALTRLQRPESW